MMKLSNFMVSSRDFALNQGDQSKQNLSFASEEDIYGHVMNSFQALMDVRTKYEGFLTHGQTVSAAAFDFARSLQDMALYTIETSEGLFDEEIGNTFSMLARVQIEVSELLDLFASHVSQTVVKPMESMMTELQEARVLKEKYSERRKSCNKQEDRLRKRKITKKTAMKEDMKKQVDYINNHVQSLFQSQSQNLLTQLAKYHSAQLHLFSKGHFSIATVEPVMKQLVEDMNIDCTLQDENPKTMLEKEDRFGDETFPHQSSGEIDVKRKLSKDGSNISSAISSSMEDRGRGQKSRSESQNEIFSTYILPSPADADHTTGIPPHQPREGYFPANTSESCSSEKIEKTSKALREDWRWRPSQIREDDEPKNAKYTHSAPFRAKPSGIESGYLAAKSGPLRSAVSLSQARHAVSAFPPVASSLQISELHKLPLPPKIPSPPPLYPVRYSAQLSEGLPRSSPSPLPQPPHLLV